MTVLAPCITVSTPEDYALAIQRLQPFAERVHIDISDGEFAPTHLVEPAQLSWPSNWIVDIHAMVAYPSQYVQALIALKPNLVIFHSEVVEDLLPTLQQLKQVGIKTGIALLRSTVPKTVAAYIEAADHVLVFSGDLGTYGGTASLMQLEKVRLIRTIHPDVEIGWDGGASLENVFSLAQGGIDVINSGGAISDAANPSDMYSKMVAEMNKHGVI